MLRFNSKLPEDRDSYSLDFTEWLSAVDADPILTASVTASPSSLTLDGPAIIAGGLVTQWVMGGTSGADYTLTWTINTVSGRQAVRPARLLVGTGSATVAQLAARALRKCGVAIVADIDRPSAAPVVTADEVVDDVMRQMGILVPENIRSLPLGGVSQAEIAARALRAVGANPATLGAVGYGTTFTSASIADDVLLQLGIPVAEVSRPAPFGVVSVTEVAARALRAVGINPSILDAAVRTAHTSTSAMVGLAALRQLGIPVAEASRPASIYTVAQAEIAARALRAVGINSVSFASVGAGTGTTKTVTQVATEALLRLGVHDSEGTPSATDQAAALVAATATHDMLVGMDFVTWTSTTIPDAAYEAYIALTANLLAPEFEKPFSPDVAAAAQGTLRLLALSGSAGQAIAAAKVLAVHEELNALGLVSWPISDVPNAYVEHYVALTELRLRPVYKPETPDDRKVNEGLHDAIIEEVRRLARIAGAEARALTKAYDVHDMLGATDFVTWGRDAIPDAAFEFYVVMTTQLLAPEFSAPVNMEAFGGAREMIRQMALSGAYGQAIAETKVLAVHEELNAMGVVSWAVTAIPIAHAEHYVQMAQATLWPVYRPETTGDRKANEEMRGAVIAEMRQAARVSGARTRAALGVQAVHDLLVAMDYVTWAPEAIPDAAHDAYVTMAVNQMAGEFDRPAPPEQFALARGTIRQIALSGSHGQTLAEAKVAAVHEELNALGLVSWGVASIPVAHAEHYVQMTQTYLWPVYKPESPADRQANLAVHAAVIGEMRAAARIVGARDRVVRAVTGVHEEMNALGLASWTSSTIPASAATAYATMATAMMGGEAGQPLDPARYVATIARIRMIAMSGPAGQALAEQKVRAAHSSLEARGKTRWTLDSLPDYVEEPYVFMAATFLAPEIGIKPDPGWWRDAEMDLARIVSLPSNHEPVMANYF